MSNATRRCVVYKFSLGDVEDPEIYAAGPILEFEKSLRGQWAKQHSVQQLEYTISSSFETMGYQCKIWAVFTEKDLTLFTLQWS